MPRKNCSHRNAFSLASIEEDSALEIGAEAVELMTNIIPESWHSCPSEALELAVMLHLDAINQQL